MCGLHDWVIRGKGKEWGCVGEEVLLREGAAKGVVRYCTVRYRVGSRVVVQYSTRTVP